VHQSSEGSVHIPLRAFLAYATVDEPHFFLLRHYPINNPVAAYFKASIRIELSYQRAASKVRIVHCILNRLPRTILYPESFQLFNKTRGYYDLELSGQRLRLRTEYLFEGKALTCVYLVLSLLESFCYFFIGEHKGNLERLFEFIKPPDQFKITITVYDCSWLMLPASNKYRTPLLNCIEDDRPMVSHSTR
jgi:hypothetical protein